MVITEAPGGVVLEDRLRLERRGAVVTAWLMRPREGNVIDEAFLSALERAIDWIDETPGLRGVIWTGEGRVFSLGADTTIFEALSADAAEAWALRAQAIGARLRDRPIPQVAALNGLALGGGLELAMWLDGRVMADHASIGLPEIKLGVMPAWGGVSNVRRAVGAGRALGALMAGEMVRADEALAWGLVHAVCPKSELLAAAEAWLMRVPSAPVALRAIRRASWGDQQHEFAEEARLFAGCLASPDAREGLRAYREKRPPRFGIQPE